jgi:hypothetical protein
MHTLARFDDTLAMEAASAEFVERIRAEREGRTAHTAQFVLGLR